MLRTVDQLRAFLHDWDAGESNSARQWVEQHTTPGFLRHLNGETFDREQFIKQVSESRSSGPYNVVDIPWFISEGDKLQTRFSLTGPGVALKFNLAIRYEGDKMHRMYEIVQPLDDGTADLKLWRHPQVETQVDSCKMPVYTAETFAKWTVDLNEEARQGQGWVEVTFEPSYQHHRSPDTWNLAQAMEALNRAAGTYKQIEAVSADWLIKDGARLSSRFYQIMDGRRIEVYYETVFNPASGKRLSACVSSRVLDAKEELFTD